jgi:hypothetical protein
MPSPKNHREIPNTGSNSLFVRRLSRVKDFVRASAVGPMSLLADDASLSPLVHTKIHLIGLIAVTQTPCRARRNERGENCCTKVLVPPEALRRYIEIFGH